MWFIHKFIGKWYQVPSDHQLLHNLPKAKVDEFRENAYLMRRMPYYRWKVEDLTLAAERMMFSGDCDAQLIGKGMLYMLKLWVENDTKLANSHNTLQDSRDKSEMIRFK